MDVTKVPYRRAKLTVWICLPSTAPAEGQRWRRYDTIVPASTSPADSLTGLSPTPSALVFWHRAVRPCWHGDQRPGVFSRLSNASLEWSCGTRHRQPEPGPTSPRRTNRVSLIPASGATNNPQPSRSTLVPSLLITSQSPPDLLCFYLHSGLFCRPKKKTQKEQKREVLPRPSPRRKEEGRRRIFPLETRSWTLSLTLIVFLYAYSLFPPHSREFLSLAPQVVI
jgi:hypothetical protein